MNVTSDWLLSHCSKLPCTHFLRELSTLPETDENEERGKTELVEIQESCEQFSGRSSSPTVSVQNWSLTLWNKRANQISVNRGFVNLSCSHQNYCQNFKLKIIHCKYLNAWFECNDIVISVYSHYPLDLNAKSSDTKGNTFSIRWFCIRIERVMTVYGNYDVIAFRSCIQIFTVYSVVMKPT